MAVTFCYALTASPGSDYVDSTHVSLLAARAVHPQACFVLVVDEQTHDELSAANAAIVRDVDRLVRVDTGQPTPALRSRFVKTSLRQVVEGDFLFLDGDTLVLDRLDELWNTAADFAAAPEVLEHDLQPWMPTRWLCYDASGRNWPPRIVEQYTRLGWPRRARCYFNSGVMFFRDTPCARRLGEEWHQRWKRYAAEIGEYSDQPALNSAIEHLGIRTAVLSPRYNALVQRCPKFARGARIYHFQADLTAGLSPQETVLTQLIQRLRNTGALDEDCLQQARENGPWVGVPRKFWRAVALRKYRLAASLAPRSLGTWVGRAAATCGHTVRDRLKIR